MKGPVKAGALLSGDGLQPSSKGAPVKFAKGKPKVIDGPFTETKELFTPELREEERLRKQAEKQTSKP